MEENSGYYSETQNKYIEAPRKQRFRLQIPYPLRFGLIWTIFFIVVGIVIQSIQKSYFVFGEFFTTNYADWFRTFGTFTDPTLYPAGIDVFYAIMRTWYYFFVTGGYLSVLWGLISTIIHREVIFKKSEKSPEPEKPLPKITEPAKPQPVQEQPKLPPVIIPSSSTQKELYEWLEEGYLSLAESNLLRAELIYAQLKRAYDPDLDSGKVLYKKLLDFYYEILDEKKNPGFNKTKDEWEG